MDKQTAFRIGLAFSAGRKFSKIAMDDGKWITIHPSGKGKNADYRRILIDDQTGEIWGGLGEENNGKTLKQAFSKEQAKEESTTPDLGRIRAFKDAIDEFAKTAGVKEKAASLEIENKDFERLVNSLGLNWALYDNVGTARKKIALVKEVDWDKLQQAISNLKNKKASKAKATATRKANAQAKAQEARNEATKAAIPDSYGRPLDDSGNVAPMKIKSKTEKAYKVEMPGGYDKWLPKSQCSESGGYISGISEWFAKKEGIDVSQSEDHKRNLSNYLKRKEQEKQDRKPVSPYRPTDTAKLREDEDNAAKSEGLIRAVVPSEWLRPPYVDQVQNIHGRKYKIERTAKNWDTFQISDDDPSLYGSHLLGYEGRQARQVYLKPV